MIIQLFLSSMKTIENLLTEGLSVFIVNIRWAVRIPYVQWELNNRTHPALGVTPYQALFGKKPLFGITDDKPQDELSQAS